MKRARREEHEKIVLDIIFLSSFLSTMVFLSAAFFDFILAVPALISFFVWFSLVLIIQSKRGMSVKASLLARRLTSGLPSNKKLHSFYVAALLVSLMLFFTLVLVEREVYLLFAFAVWLFIGSLVTQELEEGSESMKNRKTTTH
jgi:hypothetical protein